MFYSGISFSTNSVVIGLTSLLFNKTINGINSIIEKKNIFPLPLNLLNYIAWFRRYHYLKAELPFYSPCIYIFFVVGV